MSVDRYNVADILTDTTRSVRFLSDIIVPTIPVLDTDIYIISRDGDRLDSIASRFYGDSTLWWIVGEANSLSDSFYIPPGTRLRIPASAQGVLDLLQLVNSQR